MESPTEGVTIGLACIDMEVRVVEAVIRVVNIYRFGRDVQIAHPNGRLLWVEALRKVASYAVKPLQLIDVFVGPNPISLRHIRVNDRGAIDYSSEDSDILVVRPFAQAMRHGFGFAAA